MHRFSLPIQLLALFLTLSFCCLSVLPLVQAETKYKTLQKGDRGDAVNALKERMYELGYFTSKKFSPVYNDTTVERVMVLQETNGLEKTGIADPDLQILLWSDDVIMANGIRWGDRNTATKAPKTTNAPKATEKPALIEPQGNPDTPDRDEEGFLIDETEEFVHKDPDDGLWIYLSSTLQVVIRRYTDTKTPLIWFETDVRTKPEEMMKTPHIASIAHGKLYRSQSLARQNRAVLAISDDFYFYRVRNGGKPGVIIRNGEILYSRVKSKKASGFPKEEVLAYFADGSMKCFDNGEYTAEEYLDMGAVEVFSFGPILVTGGEPGPDMAKKNYYHYLEPRNALGMVEPGHYIILTVKGRSDDSKGCYFPWLADRMIELGVQEALNLDGGGTASVCFMGEQLNYKGTASRAVASLITWGTSDLVIPAE